MVLLEGNAIGLGERFTQLHGLVGLHSLHALTGKVETTQEPQETFRSSALLFALLILHKLLKSP